MKRKLRILVVSDWFPNNVNPISAIFVYNHLNKLADCGAEIYVVSPVPWSPPIIAQLMSRWGNYSRIDRKAQIGRIKVEYPRFLRLPGLWFNPYSGITCYLGIRNIVKDVYRRSPFDIIYANALIPSGYASCILARELSLPVICYAGESYVERLYFSKSSKKKAGYVITNSTRVVSASRDLRERLKEIVDPKEPIEVIYRGVDTDVFKPIDINLELKRKLSLSDCSLVITFVGALEKRKGVSDLLSVFSIVAAKLPQAHLLIVGDGPEKGNLEALSKDMGVERRVIFTGIIKNEEMPFYHSITDVIAFPSYEEGLPNAVVEAVACGKPVVATNVGGIPEVINHGINGFLTAVGDIGMLSSNIMRILKDTRLREKMGLESRRIVEAHFNARKNAEKLSSFFQQVVDEHASKIRA